MRPLKTLLLLVLVCASTAFGQWRKNGEVDKGDDAHKAVNGFGAHLLIVEKPKEFIEEWQKPEMPNINTASVVSREEPLGIFVLFAGCKPDANGNCNSEVDYTVYKPDGSVYVERKGLELWKAQAPPEPNIQLSNAILIFGLNKDDPAGEYKIKANVHDLNADISFDIKTQIHLPAQIHHARRRK